MDSTGSLPAYSDPTSSGPPPPSPPSSPPSIAPAYAPPDSGFAATPAQSGAPPYAAGSYPVTAPPMSGYGGYGGYGGQPAGYYPVYLPTQKTNGLAIASMVVAIVGALFLVCYGIGALFGFVGAILGHVARRQIRDRQEAGDGMALAGIITGWIATGLGLAFAAVVIVAISMAVTSSTYDPTYGGGLDALRLMLALSCS